jgi:hypothetical protein
LQEGVHQDEREIGHKMIFALDSYQNAENIGEQKLDNNQMCLKIKFWNFVLGFGAARAQSAGVFPQNMLINGIFGSNIQLT